jgi:hypothetical protein
VRAQSLYGLVVVAREITGPGPLDLDDARTEIRKLARGERGSDGLLEGNDGNSVQRTHE